MQSTHTHTQLFCINLYPGFPGSTLHTYKKKGQKPHQGHILEYSLRLIWSTLWNFFIVLKHSAYQKADQ